MYWDDAGVCHAVPATRGVDQGCPLSPALFALGLAATLDSVRAQLLRLDPKARVFAYLDDVVVVVDSGSAAAAAAVVGQELQRAGLEVNAGKTKAWTRDGFSPLGALEASRVPSLSLLGSAVPFLDRDEARVPVHAAVHGDEHVA
eukprot:10936712-Karenia_brevis.AAC.1